VSKCETCGSQNGDLFEVVKDGVSRTFDSFDCAIEAMAALCGNCGCLVTGKNSVDRNDGFCCKACHQQASDSSDKLVGAV